MNEIIRCSWVTKDPEYVKYHDEEWGRPVHDDRLLFEFLVLEGMQAGLSWLTILKKREAFRAAFDNFDLRKISHYDESKQAGLLLNPGIIRNRLKIKSVTQNAIGFQRIQKEFGSFDNYLWSYVERQPIKDATKSGRLRKQRISGAISKDLKKRGFNFVGPTIIYAYLQAVGVFDDHDPKCFLS